MRRYGCFERLALFDSTKHVVYKSILPFLSLPPFPCSEPGIVYAFVHRFPILGTLRCQLDYHVNNNLAINAQIPRTFAYVFFHLVLVLLYFCLRGLY
jgi:hypothetical protein